MSRYGGAGLGAVSVMHPRRRPCQKRSACCLPPVLPELFISVADKCAMRKGHAASLQYGQRGLDLLHDNRYEGMNVVTVEPNAVFFVMDYVRTREILRSRRPDFRRSEPRRAHRVEIRAC